MQDITNPRQIVLISCRGSIKSSFTPDMEIKEDLIPINNHMPISDNHYALSFQKESYASKLLESSGIFVVNFIPEKLKKEVEFCLNHSGEHLDKFKETGLTREEADSIDCCRVKEALGYLECETINTVDAGNHQVFIGKVLRSTIKKKGKKLFQ